MNLRVAVTIAAKKPEPVSMAAAAAFVLTGDDIRRSGAPTLPDALRMVPGLSVARIDNKSWAVTARGFNGAFSNKLLVLIDGRSIYSPLFSGVFWELQDVVLEDIDRIEVIRGPGAALWGANAVNGVINIITRRPAETQGTLVVGSGSVGTNETASGTVRFGGAAGSDTHYRLYSKYSGWEPGKSAAGVPVADRYQTRTLGFRADTKAAESDDLTIDGGATLVRRGESSLTPSLVPPFMTRTDATNDAMSGHLLGRWTRRLSAESELSVQSYYSHEDLARPDVRGRSDSYDIEMQHRFALGDWNDLLWGGGFRWTATGVKGSQTVRFDPASDSDQVFSAFVQDEITLMPGELRMTIGTKLEHNGYTGFELQPNLRMLWTPDERQSVWAAVSRAVRTPAAVDKSIQALERVIPGVGPAPARLPLGVTIMASDRFVSETLIAYEVGYRLRPSESFSVDTTAFYNRYDDLRSFEPGLRALSRSPVPHLAQPVTVGNGVEGSTYGVELAAEWRPVQGWRLRGSYSVLEADLHAKAGSGDTTRAQAAAGSSPRNQFSVQSSFDLWDRVQADVSLRYVDRLESLAIPSYLTADFRLGWRPFDGLDLSLIGRNLLGREHIEFMPDFLAAVPTKIGPSVYLKATVGF